MKKLYLFLILIIIASPSLFSQNFFPTELNNRYKYHSIHTGYTHAGGPWMYEESSDMVIVSDTVIQGKYYVKFNDDPLGEENFYRYSQYEQKLYIRKPGGNERLAVDFNIAAGDSFASSIKRIPYADSLYFHSNGFSKVYFNGDSVLSFEMTYSYIGFSFYQYKYVFADNIGLFRYYGFSGTGGAMSDETYTLDSAFVNTRTISCQIDSLYPLVNRPAVDFPFTLSAAYSANQPCESFFAEVKQVRGIDTIGTFNYSFNTSGKAYINITPEVGDKLLIKAVLSVHQYFDLLPDTGFAEITVLPAPLILPAGFLVYQNFPNPFNPYTIILYDIPAQSFVTLIVYDAMGNEILRPVNEEKGTGVHIYNFDGSALSSGVYFYKLTAGDYSEIKKMLLMK